MPDGDRPSRQTTRILVELRPSSALRAAKSRANLPPLHEPIGLFFAPLRRAPFAALHSLADEDL